MITKHTEHKWWIMFVDFLQTEDSPLKPLLTIMDPQIDLPYTLLEKRTCILSFDRMFVEFSLHYHYFQQNEELENIWIQYVRDIFFSPIQFSESRGIFQEKGCSKKIKEKKERRISCDYEGSIFLLPHAQ